MSRYVAHVEWHRHGELFTDNRYSREHRWTFDGGVTVAASASPQVVPAPYSVATAVDPEEAFVASLSSCHMLWFLSIAAKRGFTIDSYKDDASGLMGRDADGRLAMLEVVLKPALVWGGERSPHLAALREMHDEAHHECFIANSVKTVVRCEL
jgi:organic hydroperoxide reductase OsmC/OhrA